MDWIQRYEGGDSLLVGDMMSDEEAAGEGDDRYFELVEPAIRSATVCKKYTQSWVFCKSNHFECRVPSFCMLLMPSMTELVVEPHLAQGSDVFLVKDVGSYPQTMTPLDTHFGLLVDLPLPSF